MGLYFSIKSAGIFVHLVCCLMNIQSHAIPDRNFAENIKPNTLINMLTAAQNVLQSAKEVAAFEKSSSSDSRTGGNHPMDCAEIQEHNASPKSGIYKIWPRSRVVSGPIAVYCDMVDDGGAWTLIQKRGDFNTSEDYFYRNWTAYKDGFGDVLKDFWIGNDKIFALTNQRASTLKFGLKDWEGNVAYAEYEEFWVDDEYHNYTLHVSGYRGNAGDGFGFSNGRAFTTQDKDNDLIASTNCAVSYKGAWWYANCHRSNLNGQYLKGAHESAADGVNWSTFRGNRYSLKDTIIKIRPRGFVRKFALDATPQ